MCYLNTFLQKLVAFIWERMNLPVLHVITKCVSRKKNQNKKSHETKKITRCITC